MSAIAWWVIPIVATLGAIIWVSWASRRGPAGGSDSPETYERFRVAMTKNPPTTRPAPDGSPDEPTRPSPTGKPDEPA